MTKPLLDPDIVIEDRAGRPCLVSQRFGDLYFSAEDGMAETELVFLDGNDLPTRLRQAQYFTIAETGFGTGLNVLTLLKAWQNLGDDAPYLNYITTEIAPLDPAVIQEVLSPFDELKGLLADLLAVLPPRWPGRHRRHLFGGKVTIDFLYGDSLEMLTGADFKADAWFLDGFAPAQNPDMWQDQLFAAIAKNSTPQASLASFTAASDVRRGLEAAGFKVERLKGFGHKRHRIKGKLQRPEAASIHTKPHQGWTVIIGAGIAGASVASALKNLGHDAVVLAAGQAAADGASGNIAAVQLPRLMAKDHGIERLSLAGYSYGRWLAKTCGADLAGSGINYNWNEREVTRHHKIRDRAWPESLFITPTPEATAKDTGLEVAHPAECYPDGGGVSPKVFTERLLEGVEMQFGVKVENITKTEDETWRLQTSAGEMMADHVVMAAGAGLAAMVEDWLDPELPLQVTLGRVSHIPPDAAPILSPILDDHVLSFGGYMAKADDGQLALGASFDRDFDPDHWPEIDQDLHASNIETLPKSIADLLPKNFQSWSGRASLRLSTPDRSPIAGQVGKGLYLLAALGARGMVTGPILGQYIASLITGSPSPLDDVMLREIDPYRFSRRKGF